MTNLVLKKLLKESKDKKKIISIHSYEREGFWCGYVENFSEELVYIRHFTKFGKEDGLVVENIENIKCFDSDDDYSRAYQYLIENHEKLEIGNLLDLKMVESENWEYEMLHQLAGMGVAVSIEINSDEIYIGTIAELDEEIIKLYCLGTLGEDEGHSFFKISDITSIYYDRMEGRKRLLLSKWRKNNSM